ncbi:MULTISPECIES: glycosyltransferase family 2 protein [Leclercia]|uniref:glycosyltransferase family 2 protein n=1 Tax=Leclercia TaxID=83654 RepID=UPI000744B1A0|nr:glycosyltransferase [Leclercia adecarboxylata]ALZ95983.1 hypothetical protein APT61_08160 [Leclercia adecarboxylata]MCU6674381.1 glycosyltransferase [Leclercia adecarboxylata]MCV3301827.1 glycosyltransferase [Leclercia adecarboxylata]MCV3307581.1 glycosyltransferase [Leclercia adecarboxylata]RFS80308.1 glycosyltransferase [Leclercia adecarboxylata]
MIHNQKIGVGIVTYNRKGGLLKLINSLPLQIIDEIIIVNDGEHFIEYESIDFKYHHNEENLGVGVSKNIALRYLQSRNVEHYFLIEDDIFIKNHDVFLRYIEASKLSGIQHFNFSQHGVYNIDEQGNPKPLLRINYGKLNVSFFPACVGAFSYYSSKSLVAAGLMDEQFYNSMEHVDHTLAIINCGMHPAFYYFADIDDSQNYLGDEQWSQQQSTISTWLNSSGVIIVAMNKFHRKHGFHVNDIKLEVISEVHKQLSEIQEKYALP